MDMFPKEKYVVLETFRKNGNSVRTPVWFVEFDDLIWVITRELTGKVKRIRNNNKVNIALSNFSGKPKSKWFSGKSALVQGDLAEKAIELRNQKYGIMAKLIGIFSAKKGKYIVYSINLDDQ